MDENENFETLRLLLALKRHEIPPPGYFEHFSSEVISRIRLGGHRSSMEAEQNQWFFKLLQIFDAKPAFAGLCASGLCLLLVFGIVNAERSDSTAQAMTETGPVAQNTAPAAADPTVALSSPSVASTQPLLAENSTNPVLNFQATAQQPVPVNELFSQPAEPTVQEASFTPPGQ